MKAPVTDEQLKAIGQITVNFALLEFTISFCIYSLIGEQRIGQIITAELPFRSLLPLLYSLYEHKGKPEKRAELQNLLKQAQKAEEKRNAIIHSLWAKGLSPETITRIKTTARKLTEGIKFQFQQMTVEDLNNIADFINTIAHDFLAFNMRMYDPDFLRRHSIHLSKTRQGEER